jgi:tripartite-type tricarboxylate transporter receptor subunit TctC
MYRFLKRVVMVAAFLGAVLPLSVSAQSYPARPVKLILPFPPGSTTDATARLVADELRKNLGQPVVVDNQVGADGIIAAQAAKRAAPDGYTLFMSTNSAHGANKALYKTLPYDPEKDFEPIAGVLRNPVMLLVHKDFPADDVEGFVKVARQRGSTKPVSFGSGNTGGVVAAHLMKAEGKIEIIHAPYRGTPQALQDLVAGQIDALFADPYSSSAFVTAGQLKALAITGTSRHPLLPNLPTMAEAGYKGVDVVTWVALFAPAGTDPAIVGRLNRAMNAVLAKREMKEALLKMATFPMPMDAPELRAFVGQEISRWGRFVELAGIEKK